MGEHCGRPRKQDFRQTVSGSEQLLDLSKAERRHAQITATEKKKAHRASSLEGIRDRVHETITALKEAPVIVEGKH